MSLRHRLIGLFVIIFFVIFCGALVFIYFSLAHERQEEFFERLRQKSIITARLISELSENDQQILKILDQNSINQLSDEKIIVFDEQQRVLYASLDDEPIHYSQALFDEILQKKYVAYIDADDDETVGLLYEEGGNRYIVLASAYDKYGIHNLNQLAIYLVLVLLAGSVLIWFAGFYYIRQVFTPIDQLHTSISSITAEKLNVFIPVGKGNDELTTIAVNYNKMLGRLYEAFEAQKTFVNYASHEMKTPLARISAAIEEALSDSRSEMRDRALETTSQEVRGLSEMIESLLLLHRLQAGVPIQRKPVRIDEMLFECIHSLREWQPQVHVDLSVSESIESESQLTASVNAFLVRIALLNLLKNAAAYSTLSVVEVLLRSQEGHLCIDIANVGTGPLDSASLFRPFIRGENAAGKEGTGLGLCIARQIAQTFGGELEYRWEEATKWHHFEFKLPLQL